MAWSGVFASWVVDWGSSKLGIAGNMVPVPLARNRRRCARAPPVLRSLLIRTSTPYLPRAHMSTRDFNSLGLAHGLPRLHAGFLLTSWLVVYWRSTLVVNV